MCSVKTKKQKRKKSRNYNRNFNVKFELLVSFLFLFFFFEPDLWKLVQRRESGGDALDNCSSPFRWSSESITEQFLNYFIPRNFPARRRRLLPLLCRLKTGAGTCPAYLSSDAVARGKTPSLQVFGIGIPLLCWNCLLFFIWFRLCPPCYGLWHVCWSGGRSYSYTKHHTCRFEAPARRTPEVLLSFLCDVGVFAVEAVAVF